jgi:hypothetical protein
VRRVDHAVAGEPQAKEKAMADIKGRMLRAAKLEVGLYREVEADPQAMGQAMTVVVLSGVAAGIGSLGVLGFNGLVIGTLSALVGWYVWAYLTYLIGTRLLPEPQTRATHQELLRTIGFASAPGLIRALGIIPGLQALTFIVASLWTLAAMVIAVREALDYTSTLRAVGVCVIGWIVQSFLAWVFFSLFGGMGTPAG